MVLALFLNPWHIMKSRWALDCNLSPDFILIAISFIICGFYTLQKKKQTLLYAAGCFFFVAAAYAYGISWFMLPPFIVLIGSYLFRKKKISLTQAGVCALVMLIAGFPLILFAINLLSGGEQYRLGPLTITQLKIGRHGSTTFLSDDFAFLPFIRDAIRLIIWGDDRLLWNGIRYIGQFYNIAGIPFFIIAIFKLLKNRKHDTFDTIFFLWLISTLPIIFTVTPNTNHWNLMWFPVIYFVARGLTYCIQNTRWAKIAAISAIAALSCVFIARYAYLFNEKSPDATGFFKGIDRQIRFAESKNFERIYISNAIHQAYRVAPINRGILPDCIFVVYLFYSPVSPYSFEKTKEIRDISEPIEWIKSYGNNYFYLPQQITPTPYTAYLIPNQDLEKYAIEYDKFEVDKGGVCTLLWTKDVSITGLQQRGK
jgi:hypothetical protein